MPEKSLPSISPLELINIEQPWKESPKEVNKQKI